jgi:hypothetical protein
LGGSNGTLLLGSWQSRRGGAAPTVADAPLPVRPERRSWCCSLVASASRWPRAREPRLPEATRGCKEVGCDAVPPAPKPGGRWGPDMEETA